MIHDRDIGIGLGKVGERESGDQDLEMGIGTHRANRVRWE